MERKCETMKLKRKLLAMVLVIGLMLCLVVQVGAVRLPVGDEDDGQVYLFIYAHYVDSENAGELGHACIAVYNGTSSSITVGSYPLGAKKAVTIGTWQSGVFSASSSSLTESSGAAIQHSGIFYNLEMADLHSSSLHNTASLSCPVTSDHINRLTDFMSDRDEWSVINNCAKFARDAWNAAFASDVLVTGAITTPENLKAAIESCTAYSSVYVHGTNSCTFPNNSDMCYYSSGVKHTLIGKANMLIPNQ